MSDNDVGVNKISVDRLSLGGCGHGVTCISRSGCLFSGAVHRGVEVKSLGTASGRMRRTTGSYNYRRFVVTLPSNCSAVINDTNKRLSKNREREVSVTETVLGGTPVVVLSRTATCASPRGRTLVRRSITGLVGKGALVIVTRELSAVISTSRVFIVRGKAITRAKARGRLLTGNRVCSGV